MGYSRTTGGEPEAGMQYLRVQRASSRSDIFPKLVSMQKSMHAASFAVFRVSGTGLPNKRKLICELDNWGAAATENTAALIGAYGDILIHHIDVSLLPMSWAGPEGQPAGEDNASDCASLIRRLEDSGMPYAGIAFPVRLGAVGNGYVMFSGTSIDLSSDAVIDQHVRSCQIMMDLLALDERKAVPSETLSEREISCLQLAGDGQISEEIAEKLGLSVHTVNAYLGSATIKLDSVNRIQAIAKAIRLGYIQ